MRVTEGLDAPIIVRINPNASGSAVDITGTATVNPLTGMLPDSINLSTTNYSKSTIVSQPDGKWVISGVNANLLSTLLTITSDIGGSRSYSPTELDGLIPRKEVISTTKQAQEAKAEAIEITKILLRFQR